MSEQTELLTPEEIDINWSDDVLPENEALGIEQCLIAEIKRHCVQICAAQLAKDNARFAAERERIIKAIRDSLSLEDQCDWHIDQTDLDHLAEQIRGGKI